MLSKTKHLFFLFLLAIMLIFGCKSVRPETTTTTETVTMVKRREVPILIRPDTLKNTFYLDSLFKAISALPKGASLNLGGNTKIGNKRTSAAITKLKDGKIAFTAIASTIDTSVTVSDTTRVINNYTKEVVVERPAWYQKYLKWFYLIPIIIILIIVRKITK